MEGLIKEGQDEARVIVRIANVGELAFRAEEYGDSIFLERRFRRGSNANSYRTRAADGRRTVSDRKDEIIAFCDNFAIQVDNPLALLTQETAKKFLVNSSPKDLYAFFMKGLQFDQISNDHAYTYERMHTMDASLKLAKKSWPALQEAITKFRATVKTLEKLKNAKAQMASLRSEIAWSAVIDKEAELAQVSGELKTKRAEADSSSKEMDDLKVHTVLVV
jgi:chromosome segregation ATPase